MAMTVLEDFKVAQIGMVVADLDAAISRYIDEFSMKGWAEYYYDGALLKSQTYGTQPAKWSVRIALRGSLFDDLPQLELMEPVDGPSVYHDFLNESGPGIHHLGIVVPDIDAARREMGARGYQCLQSGRGQGVDGDGGFDYFDTRRELGAFLETIEPPAKRHHPLKVHG